MDARGNRDPFRKLNRDLALIGSGIIGACVLIGGAVGVAIGRRWAR